MVVGAITSRLRAATIHSFIVTYDVIAQTPNELDTLFFEMLYSIKVFRLCV